MKVTRTMLRQLIKEEFQKLDEIPTWRKMDAARRGVPHPGSHPGPRRSGDPDDDSDDAAELLDIAADLVSAKTGSEPIDEYDVVNEQDYKEFKEFLQEVVAMREGPISLEEAEYRGRKVKLNKPMQGDVAKFKVYMKGCGKDKDRVSKINFGSKEMRIRKSNPKARKSFRARHRCDKPAGKDRCTARYWSCRKW